MREHKDKQYTKDTNKIQTKYKQNTNKIQKYDKDMV